MKVLASLTKSQAQKIETESVNQQQNTGHHTAKHHDAQQHCMRQPQPMQGASITALMRVNDQKTEPRLVPFSIDRFLGQVSQEASFVKGMESLLKHLKICSREDQLQVLQILAQKQANEGSANFIKQFHFRIPESNEIMAGGIEFQSVFDSEEWSKVMIQGIENSPECIEGKKILDVGCGNFCFGKVALANGASQALGTDINPDAILNARINQVLFYGKESQSVVESDLLSAFMNPDGEVDEANQVDTLIACIPQIVDFGATKDSVESDKIAKTSLAEREKHSHQTPPAGGEFSPFDPYGLGLVARLLKQAPKILRSDGQLLMNIAGRPGQAIINEMFTKFGFNATPVVEKVFAQQTTGDDAVDISFFVNMENKNQVTFTFYSDPTCKEKITASQAQRLLNQNKPIYHSLTCFKVEPVARENL